MKIEREGDEVVHTHTNTHTHTYARAHYMNLQLHSYESAPRVASCRDYSLSDSVIEFSPKREVMDQRH